MSWQVEVRLVENANSEFSLDGVARSVCYLETYLALIATVVLLLVGCSGYGKLLLRVDKHQSFGNRSFECIK